MAEKEVFKITFKFEAYFTAQARAKMLFIHVSSK
jgi:hypothetical protein